MERKIHTYNSGLECYEDSIYDGTLKRYKNTINCHEPLETSVFEHIMKNCEIKTFVDIGSAWGYYSILARLYNKNTKIIGFDPDKEMIQNAHDNSVLNNTKELEFRCGAIPQDTTLKDLVNEIGEIGLVKLDIQGTAHHALESAESSISKIKNIIIGTHGLNLSGGNEHKHGISILESCGFKIKINLKQDQTPLQPDGLVWAIHDC